MCMSAFIGLTAYGSTSAISWRVLTCATGGVALHDDFACSKVWSDGYA